MFLVVSVLGLSVGGLVAYTVYGFENASIYRISIGVQLVTVDFVNQRQSWPVSSDDLKKFVREEADAGTWGYQSTWDEWWFGKLDRYRVTWTYARHSEWSIEMRLTFRSTGPFGWFSSRRDVIIPVDHLEGDVPALPRQGERRDDVARL